MKVCVVDNASGKVINSRKLEHHGNIDLRQEDKCFEQDPVCIFSTLEECLKNLKDADNVDLISVSGQMHGLVLWNSDCKFSAVTNPVNKFNRNAPNLPNPRSFSTLITWQDQRCSPEFIKKLPPSPSGAELSSGFGCCSLFWLKEKHGKTLFQEYTKSGTIMDFLTGTLCELTYSNMSPQNAASWGYFNISKCKWEEEV